MIDAATARNARFVEQGTAAFLLADLETLDLGEQRRFDKIFAMRVGLFHRDPGRARRLPDWAAGSPEPCLDSQSAFMYCI